MERAKFFTADNVKIVGDYYPASSAGKPAKGSKRAVVLLHQMPLDRKSWQGFAEKLAGSGYHVLAIDLRGHGESGGGDYRQFNDGQHQASVNDIQSAMEFFYSRGIGDIALAGASIGANLALRYYADHHGDTFAAILFSPGVNYRGIKLEDESKKVPDKDHILFIGADDDAGTMEANPAELANKCGLIKQIIFDRGGHGTELLQSHPDLADQVIAFLNSH